MNTGRHSVPTPRSADVRRRGSAQPVPTDPLNAVLELSEARKVNTGTVSAIYGVVTTSNSAIRDSFRVHGDRARGISHKFISDSILISVGHLKGAKETWDFIVAAHDSGTEVSWGFSEIAQGRPPTTAGGGHYLYGGHRPPRRPPRRLHCLLPPPSSPPPPSPAPLPSRVRAAIKPPPPSHHPSTTRPARHTATPAHHPDAPARRPDPRPRPY
ncbi:hypothetical protein C8F04DRAFT_1275115 [Mycena alexandri]|uniref:Uncharacterized protein n=1 Tax=Mycena alexandri TaxID=1745969 RepID=A0AAD6S4H1_9AGAR|nr:hypothetical protein C8F04DRAFT_1275115 [Mycena alexandri]